MMMGEGQKVRRLDHASSRGGGAQGRLRWEMEQERLCWVVRGRLEERVKITKILEFSKDAKAFERREKWEDIRRYIFSYITQDQMDERQLVVGAGSRSGRTGTGEMK